MSYAPIFLLWLLQAHAPPPRQASSFTERASSGWADVRTLQQPADRWFGEDKVRHLTMTFATTSFGHAGARALGADAHTATALGAAASVVASIGKEVFDRRAGGPFSYRDLVWDAAGILLAVAVLGNAR